MPDTAKPPAPKPEDVIPAHVGCLGNGWPMVVGTILVAGFYAALVAIPIILTIFFAYRLFQLITGG